MLEALDCPTFKLLPTETFQYAEWEQHRAGLDYHLDITKHYYSVPHALARHKLWGRITERTVEILHKGKGVVAHMSGSANYATPPWQSICPPHTVVTPVEPQPASVATPQPTGPIPRS